MGRNFGTTDNNATLLSIERLTFVDTRHLKIAKVILPAVWTRLGCQTYHPSSPSSRPSRFRNTHLREQLFPLQDRSTEILLSKAKHVIGC